MNDGTRALRRTLLGLSLLSVVLIVTTAAAIASSPAASKGIVPPAAFKPGGPMDMSLVPDFVAASGPDGSIVGYVPKSYLQPPPYAPGLVAVPPIPVYADDLKTLVGHMYPSKGFVPLGVDPASVPEIPAQVGPAAEQSAP